MTNEIKFIISRDILLIIQMKPTEQSVKSQLEEVLDPELNISIVDLGLVYGVTIDGENVKITMTLTTLGCPLYETIEQDIKSALKKIEVKPENIKVDLTFDPPWSMERMSERAKAMLGI